MWVLLIEILKALQPWSWRWQQPPQTMLVVEDVADDAEMLIEVARKLKLSWEHAKSAEEARGMLRSGRYDMVFIDIGLPYTDGWSLIGEIQRDLPWVRTIVTTGGPIEPPEGIHFECISKNVTREALERALTMRVQTKRKKE